MATITEVKANSASSGPSKSTMRIKDFLYLCLVNWYWFVISVAVCMSVAYVMYRKATPIYKKSAAFLIKTDSRGRSVSNNMAMFEDLGINAGGSNMDDEIAILRSPDLMRDVVRKLNLQTSYIVDGKFRSRPLYGSELPIQVSMPDIKEDDNASFDLKLEKNGEFEMSNLKYNGKSFGDRIIKGHIGTSIKTPLGRIEVTPSEGFENNPFGEIHVVRGTVKGVAAGLAGGLTVEHDKEGRNLVNLDFTDVSPERASDVLGQLIASYNDRWMRDKRTLADNSSKFIDERVQLLQSELGSVDDDISSFKSANLVPDVDAAASMYMSQATQASMALKDLRNQEYMAKYIRNYLRNAENQYKLLPANAGLANASLSSQIALYNTKLLERNSLVSQSSESNPLVADIDQTIAAMKGALVASIDNEIMSLGEQIRSQEGFSGSATSKIASNPKQAKYLLSVERQQKVKESLYLYLLQKREENQLNQAFTSYNTRIVREPDGSNAPIAPVPGNMYLTAFFIGLAIPALVLFQREMSVHTVRGRRDLKGMKIPLAGELPLHSKKQKLPKIGKANKDPRAKVAVKENSRNSINEAFRVLRTNVEFMLGNTTEPQVFIQTSANPGSGKTFVSYNLAKTFAIKGKKVVVVDLDMRKASLSKYADDKAKGVSDYLANRIDDINSIIHPLPDCHNMSIITVGTIPPNPTELLFSERLRELIDYLKVRFDYIFIDCPPVEVVADASIVSKYADHTLFVIRAGLLDLSMLSVIDEMYENGKYPNMSLVLNGTINPRNSYAQRYGNPYSYGYGYGTGYSYTSEE